MAPSRKVTQRSVADVRQLTERMTSLEEHGQVHVRETQQLLQELHQQLLQVDGAPPPSSSSGSSCSGVWQRSDTIDPVLPSPVRGKWISQPSPELPDGELGAGNITILGHAPDLIHCPNEEFHNNDPGV